MSLRVPQSLAHLLDPAGAVEPVAEACVFTEGPLWVAAEDALYFSDIDGDARRRWSPSGGVEVVARPANKVNGTTLDREGRQILCEHSTSLVVRVEHDGRRKVLASHHDGRELNSPNDVVVRSDGQVYFSDPWYGRMAGSGVERPRELPYCGVFRIDGAGRLQLEADGLLMPNGLCLSADERTLFVDDSEGLGVWRFAVAADGALGPGSTIFEFPAPLDGQGVPDGMKLDADGNIWCTGPGGVWVLGQDGSHLGTIECDEVIANLAWGEDWQSLFLCASTRVLRVRTRVAGHRTACSA